MRADYEALMPDGALKFIQISARPRNFPSIPYLTVYGTSGRLDTEVGRTRVSDRLYFADRLSDYFGSRSQLARIPTLPNYRLRFQVPASATLTPIR